MNQFDFSEDEQKFIDDFGLEDSKYWEKDDPNMVSIRSKVRNYYLDHQDQKCCYCHMFKQERNGKVWDIEHILPRATFPQFTFESNNLAVVCKDCNGTKLHQEVRCNTSSMYKNKYPSSSSNIKIIHPNIDNYHDHIRITRAPDGRIFHTPINNSKKAIHTFNMCNLFRFQSQAFGEENLYSKSIEEHISKTLQACIDSDMTKEEMNIAIKVAVHTAFNN